MPAFRELLLLLWCIGRGDDERGAVAEVCIGAVEPVRPQRAIGTALAHVVDDEQIGLVAEQLGEPHAPAPRAPERIVLHGLWLDGRLHVVHLLAQLADLAAIVGEFFCGVFVAHGFTPHTKFFGASLSTTSWPTSCAVGHSTQRRTRSAPLPVMERDFLRAGVSKKGIAFAMTARCHGSHQPP